MNVLSLWGYNYDTPLTAINLGAVSLRSSADIRFRIKNRSNYYTAISPSIRIDGADEFAVNQHQFMFSTDGQSFAAHLLLPDLPPTAISRALWLRRVTPSTADLGVQQANVHVYAWDWSN